MCTEKKTSKSEPNWAEIHDQEVSWRKRIIGDINEAFVVPRYVQLFYDTFGDVKNHSFFEIGSGTGDLSKAILKENKGQISRYLTSDYFRKGVEWLKRDGFETIQADALALPLKDKKFDTSIEFDVMHHVDNPREMAHEMMRIARGRCLLVESNGLSVPRKVKELTPGHRAAGERSYSPWRYRSFFEGHQGYTIVNFTIFPFLFPFKCPSRFLPTLVAFNRLIEKIPFFRWQCSSVAITVEYT